MCHHHQFKFLEQENLTGIFHKTFYLYQKISEILKRQKSEIPNPTIGTCGGLNENVPQACVVEMYYQLVVVFGEIWEVCPCWNKYATRGGL